MAAVVTLYAFPASHCSQKVRLALAEKQVPYTNRFVDIEMRLQNFEPWYMKLNPKGVVPTLIHGERVVTDSAHIIRYIDEAFEGPPLVPGDPAERESMQRWIDEQDRLRIRELTFGTMKGALGFALRKVSMPRRKAKLQRLGNANPDLAKLYEAKIEDLGQWRASITSEAEVAGIRRQLEDVLGHVDEQLGKTRYLACDSYSLADVAWTCIFARLTMLGLSASLWEKTRFPLVKAYYEDLRSRPSFAAAEIWEGPPSWSTRRALLKAMVTGSGLSQVAP